MRTGFLAVLLVLAPFSVFGYDCSNVPPFVPVGSQSAKVSADRFFWKVEQGEAVQDIEEICSGEVKVPVFDVRGREEEAYYCLKPVGQQVLTCRTSRGSQAAELDVVPASWIRTWKPSAAREYRFHAYVTRQGDSDFLDVFSRTVSFDLANQHLIVEGAVKAAPNDPLTDGYFIRVEFTK